LARRDRKWSPNLSITVRNFFIAAPVWFVCSGAEHDCVDSAGVVRFLLERPRWCDVPLHGAAVVRHVAAAAQDYTWYELAE
jgi:hypothetical protein